MGTTVSFSCRSAIGRGRGLVGISGSSSSSSPRQRVSVRQMDGKGLHVFKSWLSCMNAFENAVHLTWKISRWKRIFNLVHVGFKFVHSELQKTCEMNKIRRLFFLRSLCFSGFGRLTLAVVGIPSILALCSASFFASRAFSSSPLSERFSLPWTRETPETFT